MTTVVLTPEEREKIIELIKLHIKQHGSVRVGWAIYKVNKSKVQNHIIDKVSALVIEDNNYIKERSNPKKYEYDFNIRKNPLFKEPNWKERNPVLYDILFAVFNTALAITASIVTTAIILKSNLDDKEKEKKVLDTVYIQKIQSTPPKTKDSVVLIKDTVKAKQAKK